MKENIKHTLVVLSILIFSPGAVAQPLASLEPFLNCYKAVEKNAKVVMIGDDAALVSASRLGSFGLYAVTRSEVYYQPLPVAYGYNDVKESLYYKLYLGGNSPLYFEVKIREAEPVVKLSRERISGVVYRLFSRRGLGILDAQFQETLMDDLKAKVRLAVRTQYKKAHGSKKVSLEFFKSLRRCEQKVPRFEESEGLRSSLNQAISNMIELAGSRKAGMGLPF